MTRQPEVSRPAVDDAGTGRGFGIAYAFLNRGERTVVEVRARLSRGEVCEEEIAAVIGELQELGYLDDARYARVFTEDKRTLESWGNDRIARALRERGIDASLIDTALAEDATSGDEDSAGGELERAVGLLNRRFPGGPAQARDRQRAFGMLARKGYESELAADAVREWARGGVL